MIDNLLDSTLNIFSSLFSRLLAISINKNTLKNLRDGADNWPFFNFLLGHEGQRCEFGDNIKNIEPVHMITDDNRS